MVAIVFDQVEEALVRKIDEGAIEGDSFLPSDIEKGDSVLVFSRADGGGFYTATTKGSPVVALTGGVFTSSSRVDHLVVEVSWVEEETSEEVVETVPLVFLRPLEEDDEGAELTEDEGGDDNDDDEEGAEEVEGELGSLLGEFGLEKLYDSFFKAAGGLTAPHLRALGEEGVLALGVPKLKAKRLWKRIHDLADGRPDPSDDGSIDPEYDEDARSAALAQEDAGGLEDLEGMLGGFESSEGEGE